MVGVVGYTKFKNYSSETRIQRMAATIKTNNDQKIEYISNSFLDIASVMYPDIGFSEFAVNEDKSIGVLIYGKIFGFKHELEFLKSKGHSFKNENSCAEFIVHAYEEQGNEAFRDLNGSFCLTLFDVKVPKVLLVTDRFGTRPLYYAFMDSEIIFSSHCRAILEYPFPRKLNFKTLVKFLYYGKLGILGDETWFEGINLIPPASVLTFTEKGHTLAKYWDLIYSAKPASEDKLVQALVKAFKKAVNLRVEGLDGASVLLSGGLDSRCVLGAIKEKSKVTAVTFGIKGCDDIAIARKVTKKLGVNHLIINYDPDEIVEHCVDVVLLTDGQETASISYIPYVSQKMKEKGIKYYLQGYMLDLLLGGSYLSKELLVSENPNSLFAAMERKFSLFQPSELRELLNKKFHGYIPLIQREFIKSIMEAKGDNLPSKADYFAIETRVRRHTLMGSILHREFVEELLPTIDNEVIETIRHIPPELRRDHRIYRKFLFALNLELAKVPYQATMLPPIMPTLFWRPSMLILGALKKLTKDAFRYKHSYFEFNEILRRHPRWVILLKETLMNENALIYKLGYLNRDYVTKIIEDHFNRRSKNGEKIAFLITLEIFLRTFLGTNDVAIHIVNSSSQL